MATEVLVSTGGPSTQATSFTLPAAALAELARPRVELGGILVDQVDLESAVARIDEFVRSGRPHQIVTVNLDFLSIADTNDTFRETLNDADLAVADGMPLVWLSRLKGTPLAERVAGVELVTESCRLAAEQGRSVFLLGAAEGVADAAAKRLQEMYPGLQIAGTYSPPIGPLTLRATNRIVRMIQEAQPDFLFVALGAPRQDLWIRNNLAQLQVPVAMGVGCSFDVLAGSVRRAPLWMRRAGLEWAFRMVQEPQRLWRRYLLKDLPLLARLLLARETPAPEVVPTAS
jgi:N-acetylglucosaminyldiphosphoundecaprenol N-acetyl-beta-D-mannosaminyltransferase